MSSDYSGPTPRAAYIHVPFCVSKCDYCDFNSYPGLDDLFDRYVQALIVEINRTAVQLFSSSLRSVYIGGGTPTILQASLLTSILSALDKAFGLSPDAEITCEVNPGTADNRKLAQLRAAGFNRISLGVQSFDNNFLRRIGRIHTSEQAVDAFEAARGAGFSNIGIDLIFALPGQTVRHWSNTLDRAIELRPEHISTYELTIEDGTRFARLYAEGLLELPSEENQIEMYELAVEHLTGAGYEHYEVSNFALPRYNRGRPRYNWGRAGFRCRHNMAYWRNEPYLGFGAGATSYIGGVRAKRIIDPARYVAAIESGNDLMESSERLSGRAFYAETIIQGLRLTEGIDFYDFQQLTGADILAEFSDEITRLSARGLVEITTNALRVTHRGLLVLNDVAAEFLPG